MIHASDTLLHSKDSDKTERIIFPITRYENIIAAPRFLDLDKKINQTFSSPFILLQTDTVSMDEDEINEMTNFRFTGKR